MKSIILRLALVLAAFTIVPDALAADADGGNFFLDGKLGRGTNTSDSTGTYTQPSISWGADGGYLWKLDDASSLGFEVGYMHFGRVADSGYANVYANGVFTGEVSATAVSATAMTAGGRLQVPFGADKDWYFQVRAGWMRAKLDSSTYSYIPANGSPHLTSSDSWSENTAYLGVGIGRNITQSFSLGVAYTRYNSTDTQPSNKHIDLGVNWIGLEAEYRF